MNETVVIVGASGGIGRYLMDELGEYRVVGTYNTKPGPGLVFLDVMEPGSFASQFYGERIVLVNCFGVSHDGMAHKLSVDDWDDTIDVNLTGTFRVSGAFLNRMRTYGWGRIINLTSIVGQKGIVGTSAYAASKAGIEGMTRAMAVENASKGITVNALALGYFNVGMINTIPPEMRDKIRKTIPSGEFGHPKNIAEAIRFLIKADYVNGATININGGLL